MRVLLACMPKSGSTFLSSSIAALPGFSEVSLVPSHGHREQELCVQSLREQEQQVGEGSYVAQQHVRYSGATAEYMRAFSMRPIVLLRNIFDVVPSLVDHHSIEGYIYPSAFAPADIASRPFEEQADFVTQMAIPWYFNFYASWQQCPDKLVLYYEDLVSRPEWVLRRVCEYLQIDASDELIKTAVANANSTGKRKNKVSPGRGNNLSQENKTAIVRMANYYPDLDFSEIGISREMRAAASHLAPHAVLPHHEKRVYWLTGLSGAGKTTLARALRERLEHDGSRCVVLDGDELRKGINANLGFSEYDRTENVRRVAEIATLFRQSGCVVIVAVISPTPAQREMARMIVGEGFTEVFVDTPLEVCESRDPKGHYLRARQGRLTGFTGVSAKYVPPEHAEIVIRTTTTPINEAVEQLIAFKAAA
jgi:adenylylsulfate kinase